MRSSKKSLVAEKWVINASPVIALSRVELVELLIRLPEQAVIPRAVEDELLRATDDDPARRAVEGGMFQIVEVPTQPSEIVAWDLGQGETAVLSYALAHRNWIAVLDDGTARRCARTLSMNITGTLAVVILAKQHNLIASAAKVLHELRRVGFHLDDAIIHDALARTVGEKWKTGK